ncbi:MAG: hypothetical protein NZ700_04160 [Gemmataceae bacterium]|nr:hypothetical protein [Gemmataceae bacterium]MDW8266991.1 hypothetical protein [Gemmataceae bacterium]
MIKKLCIAGVSLAALGLLFGTTRVGSYVSTAWNKVRNTAKGQVPIEFEIERIRDQVARLVPDMKKNLTLIAEETVAVENLREEIATIRANLEREKQKILAMTEDLERGTQTIVYDGREYTRARVSEKLRRDLASYQRCEQELKSKEQLLEAKERSLEAAREQLASMRDQKRDLEVQLAQLEAELKTVRLKQTQSKFALDDSRLSDIKASLAELRNRLRVEAMTVELHGEFANDEIPVERRGQPASDIVKEVRKYFGATTDRVAERP